MMLMLCKRLIMMLRRMMMQQTDYKGSEKKNENAKQKQILGSPCVCINISMSARTRRLCLS